MNVRNAFKMTNSEMELPSVTVPGDDKLHFLDRSFFVPSFVSAAWGESIC